MIVVAYILSGCLVARISRPLLGLNRDANVFLVTGWPVVVALFAALLAAWAVDSLAG